MRSLQHKKEVRAEKARLLDGLLAIDVALGQGLGELARAARGRVRAAPLERRTLAEGARVAHQRRHAGGVARGRRDPRIGAAGKRDSKSNTLHYFKYREKDLRCFFRVWRTRGLLGNELSSTPRATSHSSHSISLQSLFDTAPIASAVRVLSFKSVALQSPPHPAIAIV